MNPGIWAPYVDWTQENDRRQKQICKAKEQAPLAVCMLLLFAVCYDIFCLLVFACFCQTVFDTFHDFFTHIEREREKNNNK